MREINAFVKRHQPSPHGRDAVRGNMPLKKLQPDKQIISILHGGLRKLCADFGYLVDTTCYTGALKTAIKRYEGYKSDYSRLFAKPVKALFEQGYGKGRSEPRKIGADPAEYPTYQDWGGLDKIFMLNGRALSYPAFKALDNKRRLFEDDLSVFLRNTLDRCFEEQDGLILKNRKTGAQCQVDNRLINTSVSEEQPLAKWLFNLKEGAANFANVNKIPESYWQYYLKSIGSTNKIVEDLIDQTFLLSELHKPPVLDLYRQNYEAIRKRTVRVFKDFDHLEEFRWNNPHFSPVISVLNIDFPAAFQTLSGGRFGDNQADIDLPTDQKKAGGCPFGHGSSETQPKPQPRSSGGGCPFGHG